MEKRNKKKGEKGKAPLSPERHPLLIKKNIIQKPSRYKPYYAGGPRINPDLLRRLDHASQGHYSATDLLNKGIFRNHIKQIELEILIDRGGIFDDRE